MGNAAICLVGKRAVRVVRPDGKVEELDSRMKVSELMMQYPDYMVVHCSTSGHSLGQRSKISIMNPEEKLVPGQAYVLYPIPAQYKQSFLKLPPPEQNQSNSAASNEGKAKKRTRRRRRASTFQAVVECLIRLLRGGPSDRPLNEGSSPLLDFSGEDAAFQATKLKEKQERLSLEPYVWKPALEAIPESPFGYHDRPQSPFSFDTSDRSFDRSVPQSPRPHAPLGLGFENDRHPFNAQF
ncbi:hypothetical protein MPTK1_4g19320 [Marchantia polymorpha subsp. ruderalis]|uniref:DUF4228 domain-containing protein n=2 Tax=Marchantia polymorpha TaxID=3197 RepID=A0AAF6BBJ8_MARPO|nr:hypothetical protein MARPO_0169s0012 [Marchantia polymorpha]BBN09382.1 hypothetical protein Mp_4g19320 [Marchantia polymorpha subsp. ruderalis]|eukprot:PTQ28247.1 hypothetical protein MARPO_0169s0012 [Marchantia polymorpha]